MSTYLDGLLGDNGDEEKKKEEEEVSYLDDMLGDSEVDYDPVETEELTRFREQGDVISSGIDEFQGVDLEEYTDYTGGDINIKYDDIEEQRAQAQSWGEKAAHGVGRTVSKTLTEVAKMPGYVGGAADWASTGFDLKEFGRFVDNAWINGIEEFSEDLNKDMLPVYTRRAVEEGNLWDNVTSIDFWATDGADGLGFLASMFIPGYAIAKLGTGAKIARGINAYGEHYNFTKAMSLGAEAANKIDNAAAITLNTVFEAGAEAAGVVDGLKKSMEQKVALGEISEEEAAQTIGEAGRNTFLTNVAILTYPNMMMHKALFGKFMPGKTLAGKLADSRGNLLPAATVMTGKERATEVGKNFIKAAFAEGAIEEGGQFAAENHFTKVAKAERENSFSEFMDSYADAWSETEGQKAMFLGAFFGGGMSFIQSHRQAKAQKESANSIINLIEKNYNQFEGNLTDIYKKDEDGKIITDETGAPVKDLNKARKILTSIGKGIVANSALEGYAESGNREAYEFAFNEQLTRFVMPYVTMDGGMDLLKKHIGNLSKNVVDQLKQMDGLDETLSAEEIKSELFQKAEKIAKQTDYMELYGDDFFDFRMKENTKEEQKYRDIFVSELKKAGVFNNARQEHVKGRISKLQQQADELSKEAEEAKFNEYMEPGQEIPGVNTNSLKIKEKIDKQIELYKKDLEVLNKDAKDLFNKAKQRAAFDTYLNSMLEDEQTTEDIEEVVDNTGNYGNTYVDDLLRNLTSKETLEYEGVEKKITHSAEFSIDADGFSNVDAEGNYIPNEFKIEDKTETGDLRVRNIQNDKLGYLRNDGSFYYEGNEYQNAVPNIILHQNDTKQRARAQARLNVIDSYIQLFKDEVNRYDKDIRKFLGYTATIEAALKRATANTSGTARVKVEGKLMSLNASQLEFRLDIMKRKMEEMQASKLETIQKIERYERNKERELNKATRGDFFLLDDYTKTIDLVKKELAKTDALIAKTEDAISTATRVLNSLKGLLRGMYTTFKNIFDDIYPEYAGFLEDADIEEKKITVLEIIEKGLSSGEISQDEVLNMVDETRLDEFLEDHTKYVQSDLKKYGINMADEVSSLTNEEVLKLVDSRMTDSNLLENKEFAYIMKQLEDRLNQFEATAEELATLENDLAILKRKKEGLEATIHNREKFLAEFNKQYNALAEAEGMFFKEEIDEWLGYKYPSYEGEIEAVIEEQLKREKDDLGIYGSDRSPRPPFFNRDSFLRTSGNQDEGTPESDRWYKFIEGVNEKANQDATDIALRAFSVYTLPEDLKEEVLFYIPSKKRSMTLKEIGDNKKLLKEASEDLKLVAVTHATGEYVRDADDKGVVYGKMGLATLTLPFKKDGKNVPRFSTGSLIEKKLDEAVSSARADGIKYNKAELKEQIENEVLAEMETARKDYAALRDEIKQQPITFSIDSKNPGAKQFPMEPGKPLGRIAEKKHQFQFKTVMMPKGSMLPLKGSNRVFPVKKGFAYVIHNGRPELLHQKTLEETKDVDRVLRLLQHYSTIEGNTPSAKEQRTPIAQQLQSIMYFNYPEKRVAEKNIQYKIYFRRKGAELVFGDKVISREALQKGTHNEEIKDFLKNKYHHVNASHLKKGKYKKLDIVKGEVKTVKEYDSYKTYIFESKVDVNLEKMGDPTAPQYKNMSLNISPTTFKRATTSKPKDAARPKPKDSGKAKTEDDIAAEAETVTTPKSSGKAMSEDDILALAEAVIAGGGKGIGGDALTKGDTLKKDVEATARTKESEGQTLSGIPMVSDPRSDEETAKEMKMTVEEYRAFKEDTADESYRVPREGVTEAPINMTKELEWFMKRFPDFPIQTVAGLVNGRAHGVFKKNLRVLISDLAAEGTVYHEAFHVVSQAFLTKSEREGLYTELKEQLGDTEIQTFDGKTVKGKFLSNEQAEEHLAEEFRNFVLSGGNYKFPKSTPKKQNFLQRLWNYITSFYNSLRGKKDKSPYTIEEIFKNIESGQQFNFKDVKGKPLQDYNRIADLTEAESVELLNDMNLRFFRVLFKNKTGAFGPETLFDFDSNLDKIYNAVKAGLMGPDNRIRPRYIQQGRHFDSIVEEHKKYLRQYNVHVKDEVEEDTRVKNSELHIESNRTSAKDLLDKPVKLLIAAIPQVEEVEREGERVLRPKTFGAFKTLSTVRFNKTLNLLNNTLSKTNSYAEMVSKLEGLTATHPEMGILLTWLKSSSSQELSNASNKFTERLQTMFFKQFSKNKNMPLVGILKENGVVSLADAVDSSLRRVVQEKWKNNVKIDQNGTFFSAKGGRLVLDNKKTIELVSGKKVSLDKLSVKDLQQGRYNLSDLVDILYGFGIDFTEVEGKISNRSMLLDSIYWILDQKNEALKGKDVLEPDDFFNRDSVKINKEIRALTDYAATMLDDDVELQYYNQEGQLEYSIVLNSYLSNTVNALNNQKDETAKERISKILPYNAETNPEGNLFSVNSYWLKKLEEAKLNLVLLRGLTPEIGSGLDTSGLEHSDFATLSFNSVMRGYYPYLRSADRKLEYAFKFSDEQGIINEEVSSDVFLDYLKDELITIAAHSQGVGKDLKNYSEKGGELRFFGDILNIDIENFKNVVAERVEFGITDYEKIVEYYLTGEHTANNKNFSRDIRRFITNATNKNIEALRENGIVEGKGEYIRVNGIDPEVVKELTDVDITETNSEGVPNNYITEGQLKQIARVFTTRYLQGAIEQTKLFTGDTAMFKSVADFHKRTTGGASTRNNTRTGTEYNEFLNKTYKRLTGTFKDHFNKYVVNDVLVDSEFIEDYKKVLPPHLSKYYTAKGKMTESDGQARLNIESYRELMIKNAAWSDNAEMTYQWEMQNYGKTLIKKGWLSQENFLNTFGEHTNNEIPVEPMFEGKVIETRDMEALPPIKPQGFGSIKNVDNLHATGFAKLSASPLLPSTIEEDSEMFWFMTNMMNKEVDILAFDSVEKGTRYEGINDFYGKDEDGDVVINPIDENLISEMSLNDFGIQLDIDPKGKQKTTLSTQKERLEFVDIFNNPNFSKKAQEELKGLKEEKNRIKNALTKQHRLNLLNELGIEETSKGVFNLKDGDISKFKNRLTKAFEERLLPYNVEEGLNLMMDSKEKLFDTLITKGNIESVLMGLYRNQVVKTKVNGGMYVQESSTGLEFERADIKRSNHLKFYHDKNGEIQSMEVEIALPKEWNGWVKTLKHKGKTGLNALNLMIAEGNPKIQKKLTEFSGNRIPGQALNSLEHVKVVRFLPTHVGHKIVLPTEIVTKSGSDFDIDKLTLYLPNFFMTKSGPKYIEYSESDEQMADRYKRAKGNKIDFMSLKEFGSLPIEEQNSIKALENRMNEIAKRVILHPENFAQLIKPQTADTLQSLAGKGDTYTLTNLHEWWYNLQVAQNNWAGLAGVGQAALHTTSHASTQESPVKIVDKIFNLFFEGQDNNGTAFMGHVFDSDGNFISSNFGEFLTAFVDIAKDPFIFRLNAGTKVFNSYAMLQRISATTPVGLKTLSEFFTQPIVLEYVKMQSVEQSLFKKNIGSMSRRDIIETLLEKYGSGEQYDTLLSTIYRDYLKADDTAEVQEGLTKKGELANKYIATRDNKGYKMFNFDMLEKSKKNLTDQVQILDNFLQYQEYARKVSAFMKATRPDVKLESSRAGLKLKLKNSEDLKKSNFFDRADIDNFIDNSMLREHQVTQESIIPTFKRFFLTDKDNSLNSVFNQFLEKLQPQLNLLSEDKAANIMNRVENHMIDYILHTNEGNEEALNTQYQELLQGANSVAKRLPGIKKLVKNNPLLDELMAVLDEFLLTRGRNTHLDNIKLFNKTFQIEEHNSLVTGFKELFESRSKKVRQFAHDLMKLSVVQSGMNQSNISFSKIVPEEHFQPFAESIISEYLFTSSVNEKAMMRSILKRAWSDNVIVPRESLLYKHAKGWGSKIKTNGTLTLQEGSLNSEMDMVAVTKQVVSGKEAKKLKKEGKVVPKETFLFENTGRTEIINQKPYVVFNPTNKYGEGRFAVEHYQEDAESFIEENNIKEKVSKKKEETPAKDTEPDLKSLKAETPVSEELVERLQTYLSTIGVNVETVNEILDKTGRATNALGIARISQKTVELVQGQKGLNALPEEAAHFYVSMLGRDNNLFKSMYNNIENYQVYNDVVETYSKEYGDNMDTLKIEAMGQLISNHIHALAEGKEYSPELSNRQQRQVKTWWGGIVKFLRSIFPKTETDPYAKSAYNILSNQVQEEVNPVVTEDLKSIPGRGRDNYERLDSLQRNRERRARNRKYNVETTNTELTPVVKEADPLENARERMLEDFDIYFSDFSWMTQEEKEAFVDGMSRGDLEIYCGL